MRFVNLVQQFYLVPQVIANTLYDLKEAKPLSPAFILGPSLGYMICYLDNIYIYFHVGPELVARNHIQVFHCLVVNQLGGQWAVKQMILSSKVQSLCNMRMQPRIINLHIIDTNILFLSRFDQDGLLEMEKMM